MENLLKQRMGVAAYCILCLLVILFALKLVLPKEAFAIPEKSRSIYITYCHKNNGGGIDLYKVHMSLNNGRFTRDNIIDIEGQLATLHGCKPANIILVNTMTIEE